MSSLAVVEEIVVVATVQQSKLMLFCFFVSTKITNSCERFLADLTEEGTNSVVNSSNMLVEMDTLREHEVTQNTLVLSQLLVNGTHMLFEVAFLGRQIVALFTSISNELVNRTNVFSKIRSEGERCVAIRTAMNELHMNRLEMILKTTSISVRLITVFTFDSLLHLIEL